MQFQLGAQMPRVREGSCEETMLGLPRLCREEGGDRGRSPRKTGKGSPVDRGCREQLPGTRVGKLQRLQRRQDWPQGPPGPSGDVKGPARSGQGPRPAEKHGEQGRALLCGVQPEHRAPSRWLGRWEGPFPEPRGRPCSPRPRLCRGETTRDWSRSRALCWGLREEGTCGHPWAQRGLTGARS